MLPSLLVPLLAAPGTDEPINLVVTHYGLDKEPHSGWVENKDEVVIGRLKDFKFYFVNFSQITDLERASFLSNGPQQALEYETETLHVNDPRIQYVGDWFEIGDYLKACNGDTSCNAIIETEAPMVRLKFHAHSWSGIAEVIVDEVLVARVDLFNRETSIPRLISISNKTHKRISVSISPTGTSNPLSKGRQVILEEVVLFGTARIDATYRKAKAVNRGGQFPPRFFEIVESLNKNHECPLVLDIGGGRRTIDVPGYINLEYSAYDEPTLYGDALALPFRSGSVDFVYTAAVLEHVPNPLLMGKESLRVLRTGGQLLANSAFMQPVHSEGQHFFNCTPYAMELIFSDLKDRKISWEGAISHTFEWMLEVAGVTGRISSDDLSSFRKLIAGFDQQVTYDGLMYIASGVWAEGVK